MSTSEESHYPPVAHMPGRVAFTWAAAGGITAGGLLVASLTFSDSLGAGAAPLSSTLLFVLGGLAGVFHGSVLGYIARDLDRPRREALASLVLALLALVPIAPLAWLATLYIALTRPFLASGQPLSISGVILAWAVGLALCGWAAWEGWRALSRAFFRCPERRKGVLIIMGILAILMLSFFLERPTIWGTEVQVKGLGAIILALGATTWIAFPLVLGVLHLVDRLVGDRWPVEEASVR